VPGKLFHANVGPDLKAGFRGTANVFELTIFPGAMQAVEELDNGAESHYFSALAIKYLQMS
jgi:hypothetical protein